MRRRDRWANVPWVTWMEGDTEGGEVDTPDIAKQTVSQAVATLVGLYARYVDMELQGDDYLVRVLPARPEREQGAMSAGLSYIGANLRNILCTAVVELDILVTGHCLYRVGSTERKRRVICSTDRTGSTSQPRTAAPITSQHGLSIERS